VFLGTYDLTVDSKGRVSVPARFRELLGGTLLLTSSLDAPASCLVGYAAAAWTAFAERLSAASQTDPSLLRIRRFLIAGAAECVIDRVGRVLLPPSLRQQAGLARDVVWLGVGQNVELWDKARWSEEQRRLREGLAGDVARLTGLGL
jgi:MraZ protein